MPADRRVRVEAFFRGRAEGPSWVPPAVAFVGLVGLTLLTTLWGLTDGPGFWLFSSASLGAYALAAFLMGWPRVLWPALPALALGTAASYAVNLATAPAWADAHLEPWLAGRLVVRVVVLSGLVGVGGTAWLWDRVRRDDVHVRPVPWGAALVAPAALLSAVVLLAPAEWEPLDPLEWGYLGRGPTPVAAVAVGLGVGLALAWGVGRGRRGAGFTFVDRFLAAGLPLVLAEAVLSPLVPLALQGLPLVERGRLSFAATAAVRSGLQGAGDAYLAAALAAGAAAALLPERYAEAGESPEAGAGASGSG